ncbi:MAG: extracellular solute-binding protein [Ktedonobacterales bacterium]|nr:extracellular solute-binding protein [Ktedonobacterales bacterium]
MHKPLWFARSFVPIILTAVVATSLAACGNNSSGGATSGKPSHPVTLTILDAGGFSSTLAQPIINAFKASHPDEVAAVNYPARIQAPALAGQLGAQESSGVVTTSLILSGFDGVADCNKAGVVESLNSYQANYFPNLDANYLPAAKSFNALAGGNAMLFSTTPSGPIFEYNPAKLPNPPTTLDALRTWIKANPKQFEYANPANSGPGRTLLMGLPYLLGDSNPADPTNGWANTWAFLKDIAPSQPAFQTGTGATMKDLANGTVTMVASTFGWDINPRFLTQVPAGDKAFELQGTTFVSDGAFMMMPKGLDADTKLVVLDLMRYMMQPAAQAMLYDSGYFYPGPAIQGITLSMAPAASQAVIQQFGDPAFDQDIANTKIVLPLSADNLTTAFDLWTKNIGGLTH